MPELGSGHIGMRAKVGPVIFCLNPVVSALAACAPHMRRRQD